MTGGFTDSPDKKYRVYGRVFGALGHTFADDTRKTVRISIVANDTNATLLFRKEYRVKGADVGWDATWNDHNDLSVVIYDYGPGVTFHGLRKDEPPRRLFRTIGYRLTPTFTEDTAK